MKIKQTNRNKEGLARPLKVTAGIPETEVGPEVTEVGEAGADLFPPGPLGAGGEAARPAGSLGHWKKVSIHIQGSIFPPGKRKQFWKTKWLSFSLLIDMELNLDLVHQIEDD